MATENTGGIVGPVWAHPNGSGAGCLTIRPFFGDTPAPAKLPPVPPANRLIVLSHETTFAYFGPRDFMRPVAAPSVKIGDTRLGHGRPGRVAAVTGVAGRGAGMPAPLAFFRRGLNRCLIKRTFTEASRPAPTS